MIIISQSTANELLNEYSNARTFQDINGNEYLSGLGSEIFIQQPQPPESIETLITLPEDNGGDDNGMGPDSSSSK